MHVPASFDCEVARNQTFLALKRRVNLIRRKRRSEKRPQLRKTHGRFLRSPQNVIRREQVEYRINIAPLEGCSPCRVESVNARAITRTAGFCSIAQVLATCRLTPGGSVATAAKPAASAAAAG